MSRNWFNIVAFTVSIACGAAAQGQVTPVSTTAKAGAYAHIDPNPVGTMTYDNHFSSASPFNFNLTKQQHDQLDANLSCDVLSTCNGSVAANGASGSATMNIHWVAVDNFPMGNPPPSGTFGGYGMFRYSFMLASPMTLNVTVTTTSNTNENQLDVLNAMAINHSLGVNNQFTEVPVVGVTQQQYQLGAGFHILLMEHYPNSGFTPWPATDVFAQTIVDFSLAAPSGNGDMDCSGSLTVADISPMVQALTDPAQYSANFACMLNGDMNSDGLINGRDLQLFVDALVP